MDKSTPSSISLQKDQKKDNWDDWYPCPQLYQVTFQIHLPLLLLKGQVQRLLLLSLHGCFCHGKNLLIKTFPGSLFNLSHFFRLIPLFFINLCKYLTTFYPLHHLKKLPVIFTGAVSPFTMVTQLHDISDLSLIYFLGNLSLILIFFMYSKRIVRRNSSAR